MKTVKELADQVNLLLKEEVDRLNNQPNKLFGAEHFDLPIDFFVSYFNEGMTAKEIVDDINNTVGY